MTELRNGQITDLLSNSMRHNPETIAMGYAVLLEKRRIMEMADRTRLMSAIEPLDERTLDYLAVELRTPSYDDRFPLETKRRLIAGTLPFYATLGTPAAVDWIIQAIFGNGRIEEWYEYGGEPHHFRAFVGNDGDAITPESLDGFRRTVSSVKRLSSWLDDIITKTTMEATSIYLAPQFTDTRSRTTLPEIEPEFPGTEIFLAPISRSQRTHTTLPVLEDPEQGTMDVTASVTGAGYSHTRTTLPELPDGAFKMQLTAEVRATGHFINRTRTRLPELKEETP